MSQGIEMKMSNKRKRKKEAEAPLSTYSLIQKKRDGKKLSKEEINWFIQGLLEGRTTDYHMSAWLMAVFLKGMDEEETAFLTDAMLYSGEVLDFKEAEVIDKHSTGGVGDKTSFVLAPIACALGVKVPMMAGRGLGHTGGTVDKIECIPGLNTSLTLKEFVEQVKKYGLALIGQTNTLAPADKKIYALRDVTATIESIPLITASIMSKKLAEGAQGIVMDIKLGDGAFMKTMPEAKNLAISLRKTAARFNRSMVTFISDMSQPLGCAVGHSLEIIESVETLKGQGPKDLTELSLQLSAAMVVLAKKAKNFKEAYVQCQRVLMNGEALSQFRQMIIRQGGDVSCIDHLEKLPVAKEKTIVKCPRTGYIRSIKNTQVGLSCVALGGGRAKANDKIDFSVGFIFHKKMGEKVKKGEALLTIFHHLHQNEMVKKMVEDFQNNIIEISPQKKSPPPLIYEMKFSKEKR